MHPDIAHSLKPNMNEIWLKDNAICKLIEQLLTWNKEIESSRSTLSQM